MPEPEWTGRYVLDFGTVIAEQAHTTTGVKDENGDDGADDDEEDPDRPQFSLITGKYRQAKRYGGKRVDDRVGLLILMYVTASEKGKAIDGMSTDLIIRNQENALALADSAAGMPSSALALRSD
jgi:diphthamide biosynthesis protein 2